MEAGERCQNDVLIGHIISTGCRRKVCDMTPDDGMGRAKPCLRPHHGRERVRDREEAEEAGQPARARVLESHKAMLNELPVEQTSFLHAVSEDFITPTYLKTTKIYILALNQVSQ